MPLTLQSHNGVTWLFLNAMSFSYHCWKSYKVVIRSFPCATDNLLLLLNTCRTEEAPVLPPRGLQATPAVRARGEGGSWHTDRRAHIWPGGHPCRVWEWREDAPHSTLAGDHTVLSTGEGHVSWVGKPVSYISSPFNQTLWRLLGSNVIFFNGNVY